MFMHNGPWDDHTAAFCPFLNWRLQREVWKKEESDFSKWMSENVDALSDAVGLNLEVIQTEKRVTGSKYEIDILCEDDDGESVIIENQLERTDHDHLGQILTYSVNMDTKTVIWVAKEARQEHINVINWLNEHTDKNFYLVIVEAYRIDNSNPAPFFSVICKPSTDQKILAKEKSEINEAREASRNRKNVSDTIVVPARKEGFDQVFLKDNCWWAIRIKESKIPEIKFIAGYQVAPISAITHVARVKEIIESPEEPGKYKVIFDGSAEKIRPIPLGKRTKIQGPAYCEFKNLEYAENLDQLFEGNLYKEIKAS